MLMTNMSKNKVILFYLLLLVSHVAHVFEEIWGRFWFIDRFLSFGWFLVVNLFLFFIPVAVFYFILQDRRWAYFMGIIYAGIMILNGIGHNGATALTQRYFGGFAGGYSGVFLVLFGAFLIFYLIKGLAADRNLHF